MRAEVESSDYGFAPETQTEWTFGFLEPSGCLPPPCIPDQFVSYTYDNSDNTGVVTVTQPAGHSDQLCTPLYVTAASWAFNKVDNIWTQTLVVANEINGGVPITQVGVYPYGAPLGCGQGDIYASRTAFPKPSPLLNGPNQPAWPEGVTPWPFAEIFLHSMGFSGPNPTYTVTSPGCNALEPVVPPYTVIEECGEYGSIVLPEHPYISYVIRDAANQVVTASEAREGVFTIIAVASFPYILKNYPAGGWLVDLGTFEDCVTLLEPIPTKEVCVGDTSASFTLPAITGVTWFVDGTQRDAGTYPVYFSVEYIVTFTIDTNADGGPFALKPGAETSFTFTFTDDQVCDPPTLPTTDALLKCSSTRPAS